MPSASLDAWIVQPNFSLSAWIIAGRHQHHRTYDHYGSDSDLYTVIDEAIGPWGGGTPVKYVIQDLYDRINRLTSYDHRVRVMALDAFVLAPATTSGGLGVKGLDAVVKKSLTGSFVLDVWVGRGGAAALDAWVRGAGSFGLYAFVI